MISAADFADVFPWMAEEETYRDQSLNSQRSQRNRGAFQREYDECIARWEDDGGKVWNLSQTDTSRSNRTPHSDRSVTSYLVTRPPFPNLAPLIINETAAEYFASRKTSRIQEKQPR